MPLREVRRTDLPEILEIRNENLSALRTPYPLTLEMQTKWFENVVCNREALSRFKVMVDHRDDLIGLIGMVGIQWENRLAELSFAAHSTHIDYENVANALHFGFSELNLRTVICETYGCNRDLHKWRDVATYFDAHLATLPDRKFHNGTYYDSFVWTYSSDTSWQAINVWKHG